mmetsp:Transcript_63049/g.184369  ORF Transcript_63049/g.184369 Transcript_63049/m.184369 type:complete len:252 (+) Transcript_63049:2511-3266(+)
MKITFASNSPKSSSFCCRGVCSSSVAACFTADWMLPISVDMPVPTAMPTQAPLETVVDEKRMFVFDWTTTSFSTGSTSLETLCDSPVSCDCSMRSVVVFSFTRRMSAGTLSPTLTSTTSPGTTSSASTCCQWPPRSTMALSGCSFFSASRAFSAFDSCQTPTKALATRMARITSGSTYAVRPSSALFSSKYARQKETRAESRRMRTRRSSNCAMISSMRDFFSCSSRQLGPYFALCSRTRASLRPSLGFTL